MGASLTYLLTSLPVSFLTQAPEKEGRVFFRRSMVIVFSSNEQATAGSSANKTSFTFGQRFLNTPTLCHYCLSRQSRCKRYARCFFAWYVCELRQWCIYALVLHTFCTCPRVISILPSCPIQCTYIIHAVVRETCHPLDHQLGHTQWNSALKRVVLPSLVSGQQSSMIMSINHSFMHIYVDQAVI